VNDATNTPKPINESQLSNVNKSGQQQITNNNPTMAQYSIHLAPISEKPDEIEEYCRFKVEPILKNIDFIEERKTYYLSSSGNYMKNSDKEMKRSFI